MHKPEHPTRSVVARGFRWLFGLALLAALLKYFGVSEIGAALGATNWRVALPAIIGLTAVHVVAAATWRLLTARLSGIGLPWRYTLRSYYASQALGCVTPANLGSDAYRIMILRGAREHWGSFTAAILVQRLSSYVVLIGLGLLATLLLGPATLGVSFTVLLAAALLLLTLIGLGFSVATRLRLRLHFRMPLGLSGFQPTSKAALAATAAQGAGLGLLFHLAALVLTLLLVLSLEPHAPLMKAFLALTVARVAIAVPISPSGLGFQEGALAILFPQIGLSSQIALAVSVLGRLALCLTISTGFLLLLAGNASLPSLEPAASGELRARSVRSLPPSS
jgi:uncharacterized protein (TIRG00374 family)